MTELFQLTSLSLENDGSPFASSSKLPNIHPTFVLPPLDDHISGTERLLGSLRGTSRHELQESKISYTSSKPNETLEDSEAADNNVAEVVEDEDIWRRAVEWPEAGLSRPRVFERLRTWDDIRSSELELKLQTPFLSEKTIFTFDSLITSLEPLISLPKLNKSAGPTPVVDSVTLLRLMMRSTLGTTTTEHLRWNKKKAEFVWADEGGRPFGTDKVMTKSVIDRFLSIGTSIRRLEIIINSQSTLPLTPTHHALLNALSTYLTFIKQRLTSAVEENQTEPQAGWNRWMGPTKDVGELGELLCELMCWPLSSSEAIAVPSRSSALLSHLYNHLLASMSTCASLSPQSPATLALAFLFSESSGPFLKLLKAWVGLSDSSSQDEDTDPNSQPWSDLGIVRTTYRGQWEYTFSSRRMPSFIPKDDRRTVFEAGKNLRLLKEATSGTHPLCSLQWDLDIGLIWGDDSTGIVNATNHHARTVRKEVDLWQNGTKNRKATLSKSASTKVSSLSSSKVQRTQPQNEQNCFAQTERDIHTGVAELDDLWALFTQSPGSHLTCENSHQESKQLWTPMSSENLNLFLSRHSTEPLLHDSPTLPIYIIIRLLSPLLIHSSLISKSLVSLYLDELNFLDHLDILQSYWLGGDMNFVHRVSGALFGKDNAGAGEGIGMGKRARTRMRLGLDMPSTARTNELNPVDNEGEWGIGLGIGLSERSKWPPGGSELAYALRTTLIDQHNSQNDEGPRGEVQDRVSFAVRQLDEEDKGRRAKWMNPQGESLDFLYLSYSPPLPITPLLPPTLLAKYQSIHNLLLKISRCQIVIRTMYFSILHQSESQDEPFKTGVDSGLNRPSSKVNNTLRRSRNRQTNTLFPAKSDIEKKVQILRFRMAHLVDAFGDYVDVSIRRKWERMRRRLVKLGKNDIDHEDSRPISPTSTNGEYMNHEEYTDEEDEKDPLSDTHIHELQSPHSILVYHQITLNRILKSCLLDERSQGQQVTMKLLMTLFGLVLDFGKILVEIERGLKGWMEGQEIIEVIEREWNGKERIFLHALERLSLRTNKETREEEKENSQDEGEEFEDDLQILLSSHGEGRRDKASEDDLKELLLRLRLGVSDMKREGRW
uniref:Spindle pole body component n=1 Tax=Kwoniella pini CBS 10737 TaxID=1296096 RepID=A0A1B9I2A2_9TREE|nr:uncharacterized protein I206_04195 [Kwoniella pini CBS 10737]OCF49673.1 hypothetical protein I206_04195 [Kwoniella pini CBS 10737]